MAMDVQVMLNSAVSVVLLLVGAIIKALWDGLNGLRSADANLADKVNAIEKLVVSDYVKRDEVTSMFHTILNKIEAAQETNNTHIMSILEKLNGKADRR